MPLNFFTLFSRMPAFRFSNGLFIQKHLKLSKGIPTLSIIAVHCCVILFRSKQNNRFNVFLCEINRMILRFERFLLEIEQFRLLAKKERLETRRVEWKT